MSTFEATLEQLPRPILKKLRSVIARVRRLLLIRGVFATLAVGLLSLLAIMAIDASVTIFSTTVRWALSLSGLLVTVIAGWWFLLRPLSRKFSLTQVARILEVRHPELQERISTAVELMSSEDPEEIKGSEELIKSVVDSAVVDVQNVDPKREFKGKRVSRFVKMALACLAILALVLVIFPTQGWNLLARAVAPFLNIGNAYANTLVVKPGDIRVAKGDEVTIEMTVTHDKLRRAELRRTLEDGTESVERMTLMGKTEAGDQKFSITFPRVENSFQYRVRAGVGLSEFFEVEAVPPPIVEETKIRFDYPAYTQLAPLEEISKTGEIRAVANTDITITSHANKEVWKAQAMINDSKELGETTIEGNLITTIFPLQSSLNGTWRLDLEDTDHFSNQPSPYPIQALPDKSPVVRITNPVVREMRLKPVEVLPISYEINEDFGFSEVAILTTPNGEPNPRVIVQPTPDSDGTAGTWRGQATLNLASLDLKNHHNRVQVRIRALDNRPEEFNGPGEGLSESITIILDRNADSLAHQTIDSQRKELTEAIRKAKSDLNNAKDEMRNAERELARKEEMSDNAERDLKDFQEKTSQARETLKEVAEKLEESVFKPQTEALEQVAEEEIAKAQEAADMIPVTDEKEERVDEAQEARKQVEQALADLAEVEKSIQETDQDREAIAKLNDLANDQRQLAMDAADQAEQEQSRPQPNPTQEDRAMKDFQRRQEMVQDDLGEMLKDNAAALEDILETQREEAAELAERAEQLAENQEEVRQMTQNEASLRKSPEQEAAIEEQVMRHLQQMQEQIARETQQVQQEIAQANEPQSSPQAENGAEQTATDPNAPGEEAPTEAQPQNNTPEPPSLQEAAEQTQNAAESLARENLPSATEAAREASEALAQAAEEAAQQEAASAEASPENAGQPEGQEMAQNSPTGNEPGSPPNQPESGSENAGQDAPESQPSQESQAENQAQGSEMAQNQGNPEPGAPGEPGSEEAPEMPNSAEALGDLAERQEALAEQIAAVEAGNLDEALQSMEQQLAEESAQLQTAADGLEETLENLNQNQSRNEANQASNALANAARRAEQAMQDLSQAQRAQDQAESRGQVQKGELSRQAQQAMMNSQSDQQQALRAMQQAAQSLARASEAIGQSMEGLQPSENDERLADSNQLAESFNDVTEAAQAQNSQQAANKSQQAAQSLQELAQQAMEQLGNMGQNLPQGQPGDQQPGQQPQPGEQQMTQPGGNQPNEGGKMADATSSSIPPELRELGITERDWARFKGALTGGSATAIDTNLPAEYRELVGRYFQVIAKEADEK